MTATLDRTGYLADVEQHMHDLLTDAARSGETVDAARRSLQAGGKRLRPLLVIAGRPTDGPVDDARFHALAVRAGAAVELVHTASLVHDDLLDDAAVRRGAPTVGAQDGRAIATATGDLLFSLAFRTLADAERDSDTTTALIAVALLADVARRLAEGEALQADQVRDTRLLETAYLARCAGKTGVLFRAALELGALFGGADETDRAALGRFGEAIGVAFQVADDVLDCGDDAELLGKLPGADVRDGTITLPMLHAIAIDPNLGPILAEGVPTDELGVTLERIRRTGGVASARQRAFEQRDAAVAELAPTAVRFDADMLRAIADRSVDRLT